MRQNNFYGYPMLQKLPVTSSKFEWIKGTSHFNEENEEGYFLEADAQYHEKLHGRHKDLLFLPERMKTEKVEKLVPNLHDKSEYVIHIKNLK